MSRIIKGYWDCEYCGKTGIDGLVDNCPGCGKQKSSHVKYYMKGTPVEVTDEELKKARIKREECDGKHKDWVCDYCDQLNNYSDAYCVACGSPKSEATREYGGTKIKKKSETQHDSGFDYVSDGTNEQHEQSSIVRNCEYVSDNEPIQGRHDEPTTNNTLQSLLRDKLPSILKIGGLVVLMGLFVWLFIYLFAPIDKEVTVNGFSWERSIHVEEERTVKEDDWYVPSGGRIYDEQLEIRDYKPVLDHYETVTENKSRQVLDHYDTTYTYTDNGNGTFTENEVKTPVYVTEYYTETHQEPVYRQEPVYDTRYYYEIERWFIIKTYQSSGKDKNPYWDESYTLTDKQRDTKRTEVYYVYYDDGSREKMSYSIWLKINEGDGYLLKQSRTGITYSKEPID